MIENERISWTGFNKLADFDYDNSYGSSKVRQDLTIIFDDGGSS